MDISDKLPPSVLIIESDEILRTSVSNTIERYNFTSLRAKDCEHAIQIYNSQKPNIVIISSRLQGLSAIEMAMKIKKQQGGDNIPIIFLIDSSESQENYKLNHELYEFVSRPINPTELVSSIKNLLRKSNPIFMDRMLKYKDLSIDLAQYAVYRSGRKIHLGPTEFKILKLLMQSPNSIFSREMIIKFVWDEAALSTIAPRTVDVHVNRLRTLIKDSKDRYQFIKTVRSSGYCLNLPGQTE